MCCYNVPCRWFSARLNTQNNAVIANTQPTISHLSLTCHSIRLCACLWIASQLYGHDVGLALHFYGGPDAPCTCVHPGVVLWGLSVPCLVADSLVLGRCAQPVVFRVCVDHVLVCSFVLHYFIIEWLQTLALIMHRCHA